MPDEAGRDVSPSRSAALELQEERRLVQEGHQFLDQKRVLLAAEIMARLGRYEARRRRWRTLHAEATGALVEAAARHGFDGLTIQPAPVLGDFSPGLSRTRAMGLELVEAAPAAGAVAAPRQAVNPSPEARQCASLHAALLLEAARLGAEACTLRRLAAEYRRTERRVRALENVLMPEIERALRLVDEGLEIYETEEAVRVREAHRRR
jgi:V/A-type H+-transporting ATPase subunit D